MFQDFQDLILTLPMRVALCCNSKFREPLLLIAHSESLMALPHTSAICPHLPDTMCLFPFFFSRLDGHLNKQHTVVVVVVVVVVVLH